MFGGLPGNIVDVVSSGTHGAVMTKKYFEDKISPLDYEPCIAEIKMIACLSADSELASDCCKLCMALSPLNLVPLIIQAHMLDGKPSNTLFYDTDYIHGSFSLNLAWKLCQEFFVDTDTVIFF